MREATKDGRKSSPVSLLRLMWPIDWGIPERFEQAGLGIRCQLARQRARVQIAIDQQGAVTGQGYQVAEIGGNRGFSLP